MVIGLRLPKSNDNIKNGQSLGREKVIMEGVHIRLLLIQGRINFRFCQVIILREGDDSTQQPVVKFTTPAVNLENKDKAWVRKKRPRKENKSPLKTTRESEGVGPVLFPLHQATSSNAKEPIIVSQEKEKRQAHVSHPQVNEVDKQGVGLEYPHDIKTTMHIDVIGPNHFRLVDEPDHPPDPPERGTNRLAANEGSAFQHESQARAMDEDEDEEVEDIVVETPQGL